MYNCSVSVFARVAGRVFFTVSLTVSVFMWPSVSVSFTDSVISFDSVCTAVSACVVKLTACSRVESVGKEKLKDNRKMMRQNEYINTRIQKNELDEFYRKAIRKRKRNYTMPYHATAHKKHPTNVNISLPVPSFPFHTQHFSQ
jgi:hypothetical protein